MATFLMKKYAINHTLDKEISLQMSINPQTDASGSWQTATEAQVRQECDPNTYTDTADLWAFASLGWVDATTADISALLAGKGTLDGTEQAFIDGCKQYGVNVFYLVGQALLESGNGSSDLASGMTYNGKKVYNFFGIGATDSNPLNGGLKYAYDHGWTTPALAIKGGADFVSGDYIGANPRQETLYKYRYNGAVHQYASDIAYPRKNAGHIADYMQDLDIEVQLLIPEYDGNPITLDIPEGDVSSNDNTGGDYTVDHNPDDNTTVDIKLKQNAFYLKDGFLYQYGTSFKMQRYGDHFFPAMHDPLKDDVSTGGGPPIADTGDGSGLQLAIAEASKDWSKLFYKSVRPIPNLDAGNYADCSAFVAWCIRDTYPKVWNNTNPMATNAIWTYFKDNHIFQGNRSEFMAFLPQLKAGDIIEYGHENTFGAGGGSHTNIMVTDTTCKSMGNSGCKEYAMTLYPTFSDWTVFGVIRPNY